MSLKQKTISGLFWSFTDSFASQGVQFIVGIILARILSPREFGLIGMLAIFIAVSQSVIDSGFSQALIRKNDCTNTDYSTVFFFNFATGLSLYVILILSAPYISSFFNEPQLKSIIQVLGSVLIINSLTIIQRTILTKHINFKLQARISIVSSVGSGIIGITLAIFNFGVWSLVALEISRQVLNSMFLWMWNHWKPNFLFSKKSFLELFGFGSKLLLSGLIDTIYRNVYYLIIGKYFSAAELGYFTRAIQFRNLPSQDLTNVIQRVTYPVLSSIKDDIPRLKGNYQKLLRSTMFISFILMLGMASVAKPMILTLVGGKWLPSVIYLQMLCFVGMFYPLSALNLNMLKVQGRSDLFLKLEIIKKTLSIPTIVIGIIWGIKIMIAGMIFNSIISYFLNSYWSGRLIGYSVKQQVIDILPSFILALSVCSLIFSLGIFIQLHHFLVLIIQITAGALLTIGISELLRFRDYLFLKELFIEKIVSIKELRIKSK